MTGETTMDYTSPDLYGETFEPSRRPVRPGRTNPDRTRSRTAKARSVELRKVRRQKGAR